MKKIKIFLASSIHDLHDERNEISSFITRTLKKAFGHTVEFDLEMCEDDTGIVSKTRKQDLYDQYIRESDYLYILFWHDAGEFTVEEFRTAYEQFQKTDKPRIIPFVKLLPEGDKGTEALETFIRYMREELQHYYVEFRHVDTVKLRILLALAQDPELHMTVELKDAQVLVNNQELTDEQDRAAISVENIPFYRNHEGINRLRAEIAELEEQKAAARLAVMQNPDDQGAWDKVYAISARWNKLQEELHKYEMQLLETSMRLTKLTADGTYVTPRTKQAVELFEAGKLKEALAVLDIDAFEADLRRAKETAVQSRKQMEALVKELTTRIDILKSQGITKENATEIQKLYEKARTITVEHRLGLDCVHDYMAFLYRQNNHTRALQVGDQLYHEYKSRGDTAESDWARFCNNLAILYKNTQRPAEAEALYLEALEICRRLAAAKPASYEPDVAMTCNNLANLYKNTQRPAEAEALYLEALEIYRRLAAA
ncbi:MAG: tetratricopeptide repeat protein, partial [Clostridia bacterium]|nr:tetratricopeptide repeat protein [Clostridia bacterium]